MSGEAGRTRNFGGSEQWDRIAAAREEWRRRDEQWQRRESPYATRPECCHARTAERTCDFQPRPTLNEYGGVVLPPFVLRARLFECADCGVGVWPADDATRENAIQRPRCTLPFCDCFDPASDPGVSQ